MKYRDDTLSLDCGLDVAIRSWGPADGPPLLAIHGWLDNVASFGRLAPLLGEFRFVAVDLPGHGRSDWKDPSAEYHYVDWVASTWDILHALGWENVTLLGHSMGAGIAGLFAGVFPDRVDRLIMLEGLGPYTTPPAASVDNLRQALESRARYFDRAPRPMADVDEAVERKLAALSYLPRDAAEALVRRGTRESEGGVAFSHDPRVAGRSLLRFTEAHVLETFARIESPTLVVSAEEGLTYPAGAGDGAERLAKIANAAAVELPGHHHFHLTNPEDVAAVIVDWLQRLRDGAGPPR